MGIKMYIMLAHIFLLNGIFVTNYNIDGFLRDKQTEFRQSLSCILF